MKDIITESIRSEAGYNLGGISTIFLLDIDYFFGLEFDDDRLYDQVLVSQIFRDIPFITLDVVDEAEFKETYTNGVFKHELKSFVRAINHQTTRLLEKVKTKRFVVVFKTYQGRYHLWGSEGGVKLSYSLQTGISSDVNGMSISLDKNSTLPLLEVKQSAMQTIPSVYIPQFDHAYCLDS